MFQDINLNQFLKNNNAKLLQEVPVPQTEKSLQIWTAKGKIFIIESYHNGFGWELYIPACEENKTHKTLDAAKEYLDTNYFTVSHVYVDNK